MAFRTPGAFARSLEKEAPVEGIFVPRPRLSVGQEVDLEIEFADSGVAFHGPGVVLWRRLSWSKRLRPGVGIDFAPRDPAKRMLLFQFAEGRSPRLLVARPRRIESAIAVEYAAAGQRRWTTITDLSDGGAFLRDADELAVGTLVHLQFARAGAKPIRIDSVVAWSRPEIGAGVRFVAAEVSGESLAGRSRETRNGR